MNAHLTMLLVNPSWMCGILRDIGLIVPHYKPVAEHGTIEGNGDHGERKAKDNI